MYKSCTLLLALILCCSAHSYSQINNFTQFQHAPLQVNPALTGATCGGRIMAISEHWRGDFYREHYNGNSMLSYDRPFDIRNDKLGMGLAAGFNQFGSYKLKHRFIQLQGAYHKVLFDTEKLQHQLSAGVSIAYVQRKFNNNTLQWGTQHNGQGGFDPTLSPYEKIQVNFLDIGLGFNWSMQFANQDHLKVGIGLDHINRPNTPSINIGNPIRLNVLSQFYAMGNFTWTKRIKIVPIFRYYREGFGDFIQGVCNYQFLFDIEKQSYLELGGGVIHYPGAFRGRTNSLLNIGYNHQHIGVHFGMYFLSSVGNQGTYTISANYRFCAT